MLMDVELENFNPLSLYRERRVQGALGIYRERISIHSPYTGRDEWYIDGRRVTNYFNPLSLYRERHLRLSL